jgi:hypothetical protein
METLTSLLVFLLISLSITDLWTSSYIFNWLRNRISRLPYTKVFICPECFSMWIGIGLSLFFNPILPFFHCIILSHLFCGSLSYLLARFMYSKGIL